MMRGARGSLQLVDDALTPERISTSHQCCGRGRGSLPRR